MIFSTGELELYFNQTTFGVERLFVAKDPERLSWVRGKTFGLPTGNNFLLKKEFSSEKFVGDFLYFSNLRCRLTVTKKSSAISFRYDFKNEGKKTIELAEGELGISIPFNDEFDKPEISLRRRVHAHIRTQGTTHVFCERYSGDLPSLGLIMIEGEAFAYSLERGACKRSRGAITLDLPANKIESGAEFSYEFLLFPCRDREDFREKAENFGFPMASANRLTVYAGEEIEIRSAKAQSLKTEDAELPFTDGKCVFSPTSVGEHRSTVLCGEKSISLCYYVIPKDLASKREEFLFNKQYLVREEGFGAFAAYDLRSGEMIVRRGVRSPFTLAGYRAAPLLFLLRRAQRSEVKEENLRKIEDAIAFYDKEIYRGGEVADDVGGKRARFFRRYYNHALFSAIKYEEYRAKGDLECLLQSAVILSNLYRSGAVYDVTPVLPIVDALREAGKNAIADDLTDLIAEAADRLISSGNKYASFKGLPYGPEIVCGALSTLLDAYFLTGKDYYLMTSREHLARLETFSYPSLDFATDEVPEIFQKDRGSGLSYDMSPHFTAVHFALVYDKYYCATGEEKYRMLAERIARACLSLFEEDGASFRSRAAARCLNGAILPDHEEISCGEDVVLYHFDLLFDRK